MKKLIYLLLPLLCFVNSSAQVLTSIIADCTMTLDGAAAGGAADTLNMPYEPGMYLGYPRLQIYTDAVKASSATDSLTMQYRPARGSAVADTFANMAWKSLVCDLFGGADVAFTDFDWVDTGWYQGIFDFDGEIPDWIQIRAWFGGASANDSLELSLLLRDLRRNP